jgi:hypothetical protein
MSWWKTAKAGDRIECVRVPEWSPENRSIGDSLAEWCAAAPVPGKIYTIAKIVCDSYTAKCMTAGLGFVLVDVVGWVSCPNLFKPVEIEPVQITRKVEEHA